MNDRAASNPISDFESDFGAYRLSGMRDFVRRCGSIMPATKAGLIGSSVLRRLSLFGHGSGLTGPHDVTIADHIRARLYPSSNRCEKRAFCGVQTWDATERDALTKALQAKSNEPFVFVDVGANVGFYTLFLHDAATRSGAALIALAIEPDPENRSRLMFNIAASGADVLVEDVAVSDSSGEGVLAGGEHNRGSVGLQDDANATGETVKLEPLASILDRRGIEKVDAMKVDIEGHDLVALRGFFTQAVPSLYPKLLIVEVGDWGQSDVVDLVEANGYRVAERTKMNAIMARQAA